MSKHHFRITAARNVHVTSDVVDLYCKVCTSPLSMLFLHYPLELISSAEFSAVRLLGAVKTGRSSCSITVQLSSIHERKEWSPEVCLKWITLLHEFVIMSKVIQRASRDTLTFGRFHAAVSLCRVWCISTGKCESSSMALSTLPMCKIAHFITNHATSALALLPVHISIADDLVF